MHPSQRHPPRPRAIVLPLLTLVTCAILAPGCTGSDATGIVEPDVVFEPEVPACDGHDGGDGTCVSTDSCIEGFTLLDSGRCAGWIHLGELDPPRADANVTHIGGERFLISGGFALNALGDVIGLNEVVLVDLSTRSITTVGHTDDNRTYHSATPLPDGRVLLAGGTSAPFSADLIDVDTGDISSGPGSGIAQSQHHVAPLPDGRILHFSGVSNGDEDRVYHPDENIWTIAPRITGTAGLSAGGRMPDGRPFHVGGWVEEKGAFAPDDRFYLFNLATERWAEQASLPVGLLNLGAAVTDDGVIVAACGSTLDANGSVTLPRSIFVNTDVGSNATFSAGIDRPFGSASCAVKALGGEEVAIVGLSQLDEEGFPAVRSPLVQVYDAERQTLTGVDGPDDGEPRTGARYGFDFAPGVGGVWAGGYSSVLGVNGYVFERTGHVDAFFIGE